MAALPVLSGKEVDRGFETIRLDGGAPNQQPHNHD
jgi:hypothetical protein